MSVDMQFGLGGFSFTMSDKQQRKLLWRIFCWNYESGTES